MIQIQLRNAAEIARGLGAIEAPGTRNKIFRKLAKLAIKSIKTRTTQQRQPDGQAFAPHAGRRKRKMLTRLIRRLAVVDITREGITIGWRNRVESMIGARHQFGHKQTVHKRDLARQAPLRRNDPATRRQARALIDAGYTIPRANGRGSRRPTVRYIITHLSMGRAGAILRALRGSRDSWTTELPARPFLGLSADDLDAISRETLALINAELSRAAA